MLAPIHSQSLAFNGDNFKAPDGKNTYHCLTQLPREKFFAFDGVSNSAAKEGSELHKETLLVSLLCQEIDFIGQPRFFLQKENEKKKTVMW